MIDAPTLDRGSGRGGPRRDPGEPALVSPRVAWMLAARPKTLPAAVAPVVVGTAVALRDDGFAPAAALAALAVALLLQIAANLANDVFDFRRGADSSDRVGPVRVSQAGLIAPNRVLIATGLVLLLSVVAGSYLVWRGGWPILTLGLLAVVSAVAYTGGPLPLGYLGLGDLFVFFFFGLVAVAGTAYVQTGELTPLALTASVPIGCLATAILVVNNLRDIDTDRRVGKRTLAVRLGVSGTRVEYGVLVAAAYLALPIGWVTGVFGGWWWLPWLSLPLAVGLARRVRTTIGPALNPLLGATARLELIVAGLLAAGLLL